MTNKDLRKAHEEQSSVRPENAGGGTTAACTFLKYVPHSEVARMSERGWSVRDELHGTNHGFYSVLMIWNGEGEPPKE